MITGPYFPQAMRVDLAWDEPPYDGPSQPICSGCDEPVNDCVCEDTDDDSDGTNDK